MHPVKWFHRGTAPMVAIYPDDIDGSNALKPMSAGLGLRPVNWSHNGSAPQKAIYPDDTDGTLRPLTHAADEMPVHWFHRGTAALAGNFNDEFVPVSGGGNEYEGPLDIVAGAFVAYSQRALSAAMRGEALYTIREDSGNTTQTFSSDATTGEAPVASINTFLNGANGFVTTWKDQAGNGVDVSTALAGEQAHWIASAINSKPSLRGRTTTLTNMFSALNVDWSAGNAVTIFSLQSSELGVLGAPVLGLYSADVSTGFELYSSGPALDVDYFGTGGYVEWDIDGTRSGFKILEATISAAGAVTIYVNGEEQAVSASGGADFPLEAITGGQIIISLAQQAASPPEGAFSKSTEHLMYASLLSAPQRLAIRQNIATYYGITL